MRYFLCVLSLICIPLFSSAKSAKPPLFSVQLKGIIESANGLDTVNEFVIRFKGKETRNDSKGLFTLLFDASSPTPPMPSLLICKRDMIKFENKNTPETIVPHPHKKHRYFVQDADETWKEEALDSQLIPENCVFIMMDPNFVDKVVPWDTELEKVVQVPFLKLPKIVLRDNISQKKKKDATIKSVNYALDSAPINQTALPQRHEVTTPRGSKIEILLPQ